MSPADKGDEKLVAQVNVRLTQPMLDKLNELRGKWVPAALLARRALEIGLAHLAEHREEVEALEPRKTGPKPKPEADERSPKRGRSNRSE